MAILLAISVFILLTGGIVWYGYKVYAKPGRVYDRLGTEGAEIAATSRYNPQSQGMLVRIVEQVGEKVPVSPADTGMVRRYLMGAGFRSDTAVPVFYGIKVLAACAMLVVAFLGGFQRADLPILRIMIPAAFAFCGWFGPGLVLEHLVRRRQERLRLSLPDALDLMVVCIEAGHALDQAFNRVSQELLMTHKDICEEFGLVTLEMKAGKRRADALRNLAERTGEPELKQLVAIVIQADRFGTSIAESLRTHADFMRVRRRQLAEERANKVGVKLVFPIFLCILPSMMIVTAGPGILSVVTQLLPALQQLGGQR
jgi:tight adherence protein C